MKKVFWFSWEQHSDDHRPLVFPPKLPILAWWCTGSGNDYSSLVAAIEADSKEECLKFVKENWEENLGEVGEIRFCELIAPEENGNYLVSSRFPTSEWMNERGIFNK